MRKSNWSKQITRHYGDTSGQQKSHYYTDKWGGGNLWSLCGHFLITRNIKLKVDKNPNINQCKICKKIHDRMEKK
jgi:hypothetical protein